MTRVAAILGTLVILGAGQSSAQATGAQPPAQPKPVKAAEQPTSRKQIVEEMMAAGRAAAQAGIQRPFQSTIGTGDAGIKIPLSITASNRTELIKENDVRASFGVTLDLDALVGGLFR